MAIIHVNSAARVNGSGDSHIKISGTLDGEVKVIYTDLAEIREIVDSIPERDKAVLRFVFAIKEAGATTLTAMAAALNGKDFVI